MIKNLKTIIKRILGTTYYWSFISKGLHILLGLFVTVFVNRALGTELKGEYAYVNNMIQILAVIGGLGVYQLYPFQRRKNGEGIKAKYINITFSLACIYGVLTFVYIVVTHNGHDIKDAIISLLMFLITIAKIVDTQFMMFASIDDFKRSKRMNIITTIGRFALFLTIFLLFKRNVIAILIGDFIYDSLGIVLYSKILNIGIRSIRFTIQGVWEIMRFGIVPMLFQLLLQLNYNIDVLYMKNFSSVSSAEIGLYSVGIQLAAYIWTIPDIFKEVLYSKTVKEDSIKDIMWCMRISIFIEIIFLLFIFVIGDKVLLILYGDEFVPAITVTKIIFAGVLCMTLFKVLTPLYNAKGKFIANLLILFASVLINLILNIILIPQYGMNGAAFASITGYFICGVVYLIRFCRDFSISFLKLVLFSSKDMRELLKQFHGTLDKNVK